MISPEGMCPFPYRHTVMCTIVGAWLGCYFTLESKLTSLCLQVRPTGLLYWRDTTTVYIVWSGEIRLVVVTLYKPLWYLILPLPVYCEVYGLS